MRGFTVDSDDRKTAAQRATELVQTRRRQPRSPAQRIAIAIAGIAILTALGSIGYV